MFRPVTKFLSACNFRRFNGLKGFFCLSAFLLVLSSCEIGLGKAVDTKVPELAITQPTNNDAPIRGAFEVIGTCTDDGDIDFIKINIDGTDKEKNDSIKKVYSAVTDGDAKKGGLTWKCLIDPVAEGIRDGSYQITVTAADTFHHETTDKVAIKIDNTAPILVLTRPSTIFNSNNPDTYGQEFSLTGQSADDSDIGEIIVKIYDDPECTNLRDTIKLGKAAPTVDMTVMEWAENGESQYNKLYGDNKKAGNKQFYCKLEIYDDARRCPDVGEEAGKGNCSTHYYLYNDIYSDVLWKYKLTQVYSMMSDTYVASGRTADDEESKSVSEQIKQILSDDARKIERGSFVLNPLNNPVFSLSGYDPLEKDEAGKCKFDEVQILNGSLITVKVTSGLDNIPLMNDTIGIDLVPANPDGTEIEGGRVFHAFLPANDKDGNKLIADEAARAERASKITAIGSYDRTIPLTLEKRDEEKGKDGLDINQYYLIKVIAYDERKNGVENNGKLYGFQFISAGVAPDLTVKSPTGITYVNSSGTINVQGTTKHEEGIPAVSVYLSTEKEPIYGPVPTNNIEATISVSKLINTGTFVEGNNTLVVRSDYGGRSNSVERTIMYDITPPEIEFTSITPVVATYTSPESKTTKTNCVNGKIKITGTMFDENGLSSVSYVVKGGNTELQSGTFPSNATTFIISDIDTTSVDNCDLIVEVTAVDRAGNSNTSSYKAENGKPYYIWQESDNPTISVTDLEIVKKDENGKIDEENLSGFINGSSMYFTLTDDDGLQKYEVKITDAATEKKQWGAENADQNQTLSGKTTASGSITVPSDPGDYCIEFTVTDKIDRAANDKFGKTTLKTYFRVESGAPMVTVVSDNKQYVAGTDGNGRKTAEIKVKISGENTTEPFTLSITTDSSSNNWTEVYSSKDDADWENSTTLDRTITIPADFPSGRENGRTYDITIRAKDHRKTTGAATFTLTVDNDKPTVTFTDGFDGEYLNPSTKFTGTAKDSTLNGNSGVSTVYYKASPEISVSSIDDLCTANGWKEASRSGDDWNFYLESPQGMGQKLYVYAVDGAGNYEGKSITFNVDSIAPEIGTISIDKTPVDGVVKITKSDIDNLSSSPIKITASVTDGTGTSGVKTVELYEGNTKKLDLSGSGDYSVAFDAATLSDGDHTFSIKATDNAGNSETKEAGFVVKVDKTAPTIDVSGVSPTVRKENDTKDYVNGKIKVTGTVTDNREIGTLLSWSAGSGSKTDSGTVTLDSGKTFLTWSFEVDTTKLSDGENEIKINISDAFGNVSEKTYKINVDQSTDRPTIKLTNLEAVGADKIAVNKNLLGKSSNNIITGLVTDDDGVATVKARYRKAKSVNSSDKSVIGWDDNDWSAPSDIITGGTSPTTSFSYSVADRDDGIYELEITVLDTVTSSTDYNNGDYGTAQKSEIYFGVSSGAPVLRLDTENNQLCKENSTRTVELYAKSGLGSDGYTLTATGTNLNTVSGPTKGTTSDGEDKWTHEFTTAASQGTYNINYTAKDYFGQETPVTFTYQIDLTKPEVSIDTKPMTNQNAISEKSYTFYGGSTDPGDGTTIVRSGVKEVYYKVLSASTSSSDEPKTDSLGTGWTAIGSTGIWNVKLDFKDFEATGDGIEEGSYKLWVYSEDKAGNTSEPKSVSFDVNLNSPEVTTEIKVDGTADNSPEIKTNKTYTFSFTVKDTYKLHSENPYTLSVTKDGKTITTPPDVTLDSSATNTDKEKTYIVTVPTDDGRYIYSVNAKDTFGRSADTATVRTVLLDKTGPDINFKAPFKDKNESAWRNSPLTVEGTSNDKYSDVAAVYYAVGTKPANLNDWTEVLDPSEWSFTPEPSDGDNKIYVVAVDSLGNKTEAAEKTIKYDSKAPVISKFAATKEKINIDDYENNLASNSISVDVADQEGLSRVKEVSLYEGTKKITTLALGSGTTYSVKLSDIKENLTTGTHTFQINATDIAGNEATSSENVVIVVDREKPTVTISGYTPTVESGKVNGKISVSGTASDTTELGTEIKYKVIKGTNDTTVPDTSAPLVVSGTTYSTWSFVLDTTGLSDNEEYTIYVSVVDAAGNTSEIKKVTFTPDQETDKPKITLSNADKELTDNTKVKEGSNLFGMGSNTIYGSADDDDGISSVLCYIDPEFEGNTVKSYAAKAEFSKAISLKLDEIEYTKDGTTVTGITGGDHTLYIVATDVANAIDTETDPTKTMNLTDANVTKSKVIAFAFDDKAPTITVSKLNGENYVKNQWAKASFDVIGTVEDDSGVKSVTMKEDTANPKTNLLDSGSTTTWTKTLSGLVDGSHSRTFIVTDKYGRTSETKIEFRIDLTPPVLNKEKITLTETGKAAVKASEYGNTDNTNIRWNITGAVKIDGAGYTNADKNDGALTEDNPKKVTVKTQFGTEEPVETDVIVGEKNKFTTTASFADGTTTMTINAVDEANQAVEEPIVITFKVDTHAPAFKDGSIEVSDNAINANDLKSGAKPITFKIAAKDVTSGLATSNVRLYDGSADTGLTAASSSTADGEEYYIYTFTLTDTVLTNGTHNFAIHATDTAGNTAVSETRQITVDKTAPVLILNGVTPTVNESGTEYVNGNITISGTASDETKLSRIYYKIDDTDTKTDASGTAQWNIPIDTTTLSDNATHTVHIYAIDAAENITEQTQTIKVKQSTDTPSVTLTGLNAGASADDYNADTNTTGIHVGYNLLTPSNNKISATISDDDGIAKYSVWYKGAGTTSTPADYIKIGNEVELTSHPKTYSLSCDLPESIADGRYSIKIMVEDYLGETTNEYKVESTPVIIGYSSKVPELNIKTANGSFRAPETDIDINGTITSGMGYKLTKVGSSDVIASATSGTGSSSNSWTDKIKADKEEGLKEVKYVVTDVFGQTSTTQTFTYQIDKTAPTVSFSANDNSDKTGLNAITNSSYTFRGTSSDPDKVTVDGAEKTVASSGVKNVYYKVLAADAATPETTDNDWNSTGASGEWNIPFEFVKFGTTISAAEKTRKFQEGNYKLWVYAEDDAGNTSEIKSISFDVDINAPIISGETITVRNVNSTVYDEIDDTSKPAKFSAHIEDSGSISSISSVKLYDGNTEMASATLLAPADGKHYGDYEFIINKDWLTTGEHNFKIRATDATGLTADSAVQAVSVDIEPPTLNITSITPYVDVTDSGVTRRNLNGIITIEGNARDSNSLKSIECKVYKGSTNASSGNVSSTEGLVYYYNNNVIASTNIITDVTKLNSWLFQIDTKVLKESGDSYYTGDIYIEIIATDAVDNTTTVASTEFNADACYRVDQETDRPTIEPTNFSLDGSAADVVVGSNRLFGTTSNNLLTATVKDDDGIAKVTVTYKLNGTGEAITKTFTPSGTPTTYPLSCKLVDGTGNDGDPLAEGKYTVSITVEDKNCNTTNAALTPYNNSTNTTWVGVSAGAPSVSISSPSSNNGWYSSNENATQNTISAAFSVTSATIASVSRTIAQGSTDVSSGSATITTIDPDTDKKAEYSDTIDLKTVHGATGDGNTYTVTYTATDIFGQTGNADFTYRIDNSVPETATNFTVDSTTYKEKINNADYDADKYYNNKSIKIEGFFKDSGSGIDRVDYWIAAAQPSTSVEPTGSFTVSRIGTTENYKFTSSVDISETASNIYLVAVDSVGNKSATKVFALKLDETDPDLSLVSVDNVPGVTSKLVNKTADVTFIVSATDGTGSGIASVKYDATELTAPNAKSDTALENNDVYEFTINKNDLAPGGVSVEVIDKAGNKKSDTLFSISVDDKAPDVVLNPIADADASTDGIQVNKTITLSGTGNDGNTLTAAPMFWYATGATCPDTFTVTRDDTTGEITGMTGWTRLTDGNATPANLGITSTSSSYNWTTGGINTAAAFGSVEATTPVYSCATIEDAAHNVGHSDVITIYVDQNSDRPVITISDIKSDGTTLLMNNRIYGSLIDDDGAIKGLWYCEGASPIRDVPILSNDNGWTKIDVSNNSWNVDIDSDKQGEKTLWFYCIDAKDGTFDQKATDKKERLYITFGDATKQDDKDIKFKLDMVSPVVSEIYLAKESAPTAIDSYAWESATWRNENNQFFGGATGYLYGKAIVNEATGMNAAPISVKIGETVLPLTDDSWKQLAKTGDDYTYIFGPINVSEKNGANFVYESASTSITVTAKDGADRTGVSSKTINIDNEAPTVRVTYPTDIVTTSVSISGSIQENSGGSGVKEMYYMIPTQTAKGSIDKDSTGWISLEAGSSWSIDMMGTSNTATNYLGYYANDTYAVKKSDGVWEIPLYFKTVDEIGNVSVDKSNSIVFDAESGKPYAEIIYPADNAIVGGTVTVSGSARDDVEVKSVRLKVDVNNDGEYDADDLKLLFTVTEDASNKITAVATKDIIATDYLVYNDKATTSSDFDWYLLAEGTNSWKLPIKTSVMYLDETCSECSGTGCDVCNGTGKKSVSNIKVCAQAYDENSTRAPVSISLEIDKNVPVISDLKLVQKTGSATLITRDYSDGMYISNNNSDATWYFEGSLSDDTGVKNLLIEKQGNSNLELKYDEKHLDSTIIESFSIPLTIEADGQFYSKITATDGNSTSTSQFVRFNVDSTAPSMYKLEDGGTESPKSSGIGDNLRLKSASNYVNATPIQNNNVVYTFGDVVTEGGSGLDYIAFYFKRIGKTGETRIYDPMVEHGEKTDKYANQIDIDKTVNSTNATAGKIYINSDELAVMYISEDSRSDTSKITYDGLKNSQNVRVGGLIKIGGSYRLVTAFDKTNGTITFSPAVETTFTDAEVVFAQVVDHQITEGPTNGNYKVVQNDDGDGMIEKISNVGDSYTWTASIFSDNVPDGPIELHVVAIDKAGNLNHGWVTTSVQNSRPRIAKVLLGTDLNYDGKVEYKSTKKPETSLDGTLDGTSYGEFNYYKTLGETEKDKDGKSEATINTFKNGVCKFTIKNNLVLIPEFVGGNGDISYLYQVTEKEPAAYTKQTGTPTTPLLKAIAAGETGAGTVSDLTYYVKNTDDEQGDVIANHITAKGGLVLSRDVLKNMKDTGGVKSIESANETDTKYFAFTFWDSTEELTPGTDTQYAQIIVPAIVDVMDNKPPTATIKPFYWHKRGIGEDGASNNSLQWNNDTALGHIELEGDLPGATFTTGGNGVYDRDPKVSGAIKIEGSAYDESRLTKITINRTTGSGSGTTTELASATYSNGAWTSSDATKLTIAGEGISQSGHSVTWTYLYDTPAAQADLKITVVANDGSDSVTNGNASTPGSTQTALWNADGTARGNETGYYKMDVVPYVTKVSTSLSRHKVTNWSVYNRTALGHYPVQSVVKNVENNILKTTTSETVTLYGFNLNGDVKIANSTNLNKDTEGQVSFNVINLQSGEIDMTVQDIPILNNINNNDAKGSATTEGEAYRNWYNRQGNGDTNNILTDDIVFDVWEFNDRAAMSLNGLLAGVNMKINQQTKMIQYAFANGGLFYSMGGKVSNIDYSSIYWAADWDTFAGPCVGFHVDELGHTYSSCSGGDTNSGGSVDSYVLWTDRWGLGDRGTGGTLGGTNALRLEKIGLKTGSNQFDYSLSKNRILSSEYASSVSGQNTNLYFVYYDMLCDEIRFRAGTFSGNSKQNTGGFVDEYTGGNSYYYGIANCQVIANGSTITYKQNDGTKTVNKIDGRGSGMYVAVGVAKNDSSKDVVCVVWYDAYANNLKYSYITDPISNWDRLKGNATPETNTNANARWSSPKVIFAEGGEYCQIAVDKNNHIHIAAYAGNGDVKYAYLDNYGSDYSESTNSCVVDASGAVGEHLTLDVAVDSSGNSVPYIGYYTSAIKMPKYAYLVDTANANHVPAGVDENERFTGAWEVTVVPSPSRMTTNREDKVNIGVWKNAGVLTDSKIGTGAQPKSTYSNSLSGYDSASSSKTYGNGTSNAVLGYQISAGANTCLETAQMR